MELLGDESPLVRPCCLSKPDIGNRHPAADPVQWRRVWRDTLMKKLVLAVLLIASPAWAQTKLVPKSAARVDNCAPIGRTADGKLVYSMKCEFLPAPPPPPPQAEVEPPPEPEVQRSGIFGLSLSRTGEPARPPSAGQ